MISPTNLVSRLILRTSNAQPRRPTVLALPTMAYIRLHPSASGFHPCPRTLGLLLETNSPGSHKGSTMPWTHCSKTFTRHAVKRCIRRRASSLSDKIQCDDSQVLRPMTRDISDSERYPECGLPALECVPVRSEAHARRQVLSGQPLRRALSCQCLTGKNLREIAISPAAIIVS